VGVKPTLDTEKCLISVLWSVNRIHSVVDILEAETSNLAFFSDLDLPSPLKNICSRSDARSLNGVCPHLDIVHVRRIHFSPVIAVRPPKPGGWYDRLIVQTGRGVTSSFWFSETTNPKSPFAESKDPQQHDMPNIQ
jgi:hypothetical protein